jgi:heparanase
MGCRWLLLSLLLHSCAASSGTVSAGDRNSRTTQCPAQIEQNVVIGKGYQHAPAADLAACCAMCSEATASCAAFTFEAAQGVCYLKGDAAGKTHKDGATSGTMPPAPTPPPAPPPPPPAPARATVAVSTAALRSTVDAGFKCWNIDSSPNRQFFQRDLADPLLRSLGRQSVPGYLRFGGSGNDGLVYARDMGDPSSAGNGCAHHATGDNKLPGTRCLNRTWFDALMGFSEASGAPIVFGLNIATGNGTGWDPADARALLSYAIAANHTFYGFELGNEQNKKYSPRQEALAFLALSELLVELYPHAPSRPKLLGCDGYGFHYPPSQGGKCADKLAFVADFAANCSALGVPLHAVTHHEYIDVDANPAAPANHSLLSVTGEIARDVNATLVARGVAPAAQIWGGEIGPHNGGSPGCSRSSMRWANFGNTFWYLDAMASKAAHGYSVFCRQDFIGIDYGMLDCETHAPLPDYYGGVLWSTLMGRGVLGAAVVAGAPSVRAYAHCAAGAAAVGATVLLLNLDAAANATVSLGRFGGQASTARKEWHLTGPNGTDSTTVALNGKALTFSVDPVSGGAVLPALEGRVVARVPGQDDVVHVQAASIVFVQVGDGAAADLCASAAAGRDSKFA